MLMISAGKQPLRRVANSGACPDRSCLRPYQEWTLTTRACRLKVLRLERCKPCLCRRSSPRLIDMLSVLDLIHTGVKYEDMLESSPLIFGPDFELGPPAEWFSSCRMGWVGMVKCRLSKRSFTWDSHWLENH